MEDSAVKKWKIEQISNRYAVIGIYVTLDCHCKEMAEELRDFLNRRHVPVCCRIDHVNKLTEPIYWKWIQAERSN